MTGPIGPSTTGNRTRASKHGYRPEIDGLRAFAVVAVIINHFNKDLLPGGYLGVDIFFVISGFVITSSLAGRESKNFLDFLSGFYERRIRRLVPALVIFVLITSVLISLFNPEPGVVLGTGWRSLFGISNINLYQASTDYFAQSTELNPFTHTWSLGVEEQFYLLFPFLIWFSGFAQQTLNGSRNLFSWVGVMTIASLIGFIYLYQVNQPAAYFLMPTRFWEMAAGCLLFIGLLKRASIKQAVENFPPLLVVATLVGLMFLPVSAAVPATIGVVVLSAILITCLKKGTFAYQFFTLQKVVYIGLISYSLYLWHWTVLSISRWTIGVYWWTIPFQIAIMLVLAIVSHRWIEIPFRKRSLFAKRWKNLLVGAGVAAGVGAVIATLGKFSIYRDIYALVNQRSGSKLSGTPWSKSNSASDRKLANCHFHTQVTYDDIINCFSPSIPRNSALKSNNWKILVIGDSKAANYVFALNKAFPLRTRMVTHCGYVPHGKFELKCQDYSTKIFRYFNSNASPGDVVIVGNAWQKFVGNKQLIQLQTDNLDALASMLASKGAHLTIVDDVPLEIDLELCSPKWYRPNLMQTCLTSIGEADSIQRDLDRMGSSLQHKYSNVSYLSLRKFLCLDRGVCTPTSNAGINLYRNQGHLSIEGSRLLAENFRSHILKSKNANN